MSASIIVDYDGNLDDAQALPIGFPKDFCACAHVGFYGINGGNRSTRVRTEATLSVSDACIVSGPQVRESCDNPDSKFPIAGYSMSLVALQKSRADANIGLSVSDRGRDFRNHFRSVLTVSVKDDEHSKVVGARIVETRTEGRTIPAIGWMLDYGGPSLFGYPGRLVV